MYPDTTHGDVQYDTSHDDVKLKEHNHLLTQSLKYIIDQHDKTKIKLGLRLIYSKLRDMFEGTFA